MENGSTITSLHQKTTMLRLKANAHHYVKVMFIIFPFRDAVSGVFYIPTSGTETHKER